MSVRFHQMLFQHLLIIFSFFILLMWCYIHCSLTLNHPCVLRISSTKLWYLIPFLYYWILLANILFRMFTSRFMSNSISTFTSNNSFYSCDDVLGSFVAKLHWSKINCNAFPCHIFWKCLYNVTFLPSLLERLHNWSKVWALSFLYGEVFNYKVFNRYRALQILIFSYITFGILHF